MPLDTSETQKLIDAVESFETRTRDEAEAILVKGAVEMKRNLKENARGSKYFKQFAKKITYDKKRRASGVEIELGPENDKPTGKKPGGGPGAGVAYFGGANGGGGTLDFDEPVEREFDAIDSYMKKLGDAL
ncbi:MULTISPECIES: HK97 gp10 family phage protein [unclassified Brevibacterium]|uniref:HK97 gp10 family phage protein n=1 Tax=unclassified Brevibacterium TaxID=2614124 RepID=UPI001E3B7A0C|nr:MULTISPECIES: HK97 gp10 family phage protein [unclassified Brevibacterium]MCD1286487.1 hypothetical protein [Brevibacterium sp. CCUG 69071]MDK8434279.1 HK97 gp10 family phage protein [Brevibacterium sp. H-BE7]